MNKSIVSAVIFSMICSVSFIFGFLFNEAYQPEKRELISETINQNSELRELLDAYGWVVLSELAVKDLEQIYDQQGILALKEKYKENGKRHIKYFRKKLAEIKSKVPNPDALDDFEANVNKMEAVFE